MGEYWWLWVPLGIYIALNIWWIIAMLVGSVQGYGFNSTPRDFADSLGINLIGGTTLFILGCLLFPLWNLLLWMCKFFDWLFHIGIERNEHR